MQTSRTIQTRTIPPRRPPFQPSIPRPQFGAVDFNQLQDLPKGASILLLIRGAADSQLTTTPMADALGEHRDDVLSLVFDAGERSDVSSSGWIQTTDSFEHAQRWLQLGHVVLYEATLEEGLEGVIRTAAQLSAASRTPLVCAKLRKTTGASSGAHLELQLSSKIRAEALSAMSDDRARIALIRWHLLAMQARSNAQPPWVCSATDGQAPVAGPLPQAELEKEILGLPESARLIRTDAYSVYAVQGRAAPRALREIARLRELTFRQVGEGTGRPLDIDRYDLDYTHLFVYLPNECQIIGAYRLRPVDQALQAGGVDALYSSSLFSYEPGFFEALGQTLELGRSFVVPGHQKSSRTLLWLWKGIGQYLQRNVQYRYLLGPVSISADYQPLSRALMSQVFLKGEHRHPLADRVRPRTPPAGLSRPQNLDDPGLLLQDPDVLASVVASAETDHKGLPTLVREYLNLGGRFLGFNVDPDFSNVLDGLVVVDLAKTNPRLLDFYMGKAAARLYREALTIPCSKASQNSENTKS